MAMLDTDKAFGGSIPRLYETHLVPMIFQPYAADLARRLAARALDRVLELAAGTGVVTRALSASLPERVSIVATDLNQPMLDLASSLGTTRPVEWRQADAMALPFPDATFDAVVCQFGVMFFPDKAAAFAEARRVLRPGGVFLFNVWDRLEDNELTHCVQQALEAVFPDDPCHFMERTPHGYHDLSIVRRDLVGGGFDARPELATVAARSPAESARLAATALCQGTPLRNEIEARGPGRLAEVTDRVTEALAHRFGGGPVDGKIQAHVVSVER
jgi:SAM-dependent methyltransferase